MKGIQHTPPSHVTCPEKLSTFEFQSLGTVKKKKTDAVKLRNYSPELESWIITLLLMVKVMKEGLQNFIDW